MRNTVPKVAVFLCALFLLTTSQVSAVSSKQLALTEDPFHYRETALKQAEIVKEKEELKQQEAEKEQAEKKTQEAAKVVEKPVINHVVAPGESLAKIAATYNTTWQRLYAKNTQIAQPDIININDTLVIPEASEELPERAAPVVEPVATSTNTNKPTAKTSPRLGTQVRGSSAGNTYTAGYCTWYAKSRRPDLPNRMGNASSWVASAAAQGFATGTAPQAGAIGQQGNHVVYVESVNGDGTVTVSEMNYAGFGIVSSRTVPAGTFRYIY